MNVIMIVHFETFIKHNKDFKFSRDFINMTYFGQVL